MTSTSTNRLELVIKALGPVLVVAGLVFGVIQFRTTATKDRTARLDQHNHMLAEAQREAKKPFYEQQLDLYLQATDVASRLALPKSEDDRADATLRFWQLYWGQLAMVESPDVAKSMVDIKKILENGDLSDSLRTERLTRASIDLAHRCRESLKESWDVDLPKLSGR